MRGGAHAQRFHRHVKGRFTVMNKRSTPRLLALTLFALALVVAVLSLAACGDTGISSSESNKAKILIASPTAAPTPTEPITAALTTVATDTEATTATPDATGTALSGKVTICHATGSPSNPYVLITVD